MNKYVPYIWRKNYCTDGPWTKNVLQTAHEQAQQLINRAAGSSAGDRTHEK
jgi:hypothetical protein